MTEVVSSYRNASTRPVAKPVAPIEDRAAFISEEVTATGNDGLAALVFNEIQNKAASVATAKNMVNMLPLNEGSLGDFPWFWQSGLDFNAATYNWLNQLFAYDASGYVGTNGEALTTAYNNVLQDIAYVLDDADAAALNNANLAIATVVNTMLTDFTTLVGPVTGTAAPQQLNYVIGQILTWGTPGLTLNQLRNSSNPMALLPNVPLGADPVVSDVMTYLAKTSSVAHIQAAVVSMNYQLAETLTNVDPTTPPKSAGPGFMTTADDHAVLQIVPAVTIAESTAVIQNNLLPSSGQGSTFSASFVATSSDQKTMQLSIDGSGGVGGDAGFFFSFGASASVSYNLFEFASDATTCQVKLTFNGVTTVTPTMAGYNVSTGTGWWNPDPIVEAANPVANQSGYQFTPTPPYNFGVKGDFGVIGRLLISQQPVISMTYSTSHYAEMQQIFQETVSWDTSFCGISLGGGSQSYYSASLTQNASAQTVTVTMNPVGNKTPVTATDQLAYVIGAQILWPGASASQNAAGI
ncbi:MAG TPA: hypothetical protein VF911_10645 [Thermoanaerobaculia bacterium]|jgi:hypothetical protein